MLVDEVASSVDEHARFGGVVPEIASRAHLEAMVPTFERACKTANIKLADVAPAAESPIQRARRIYGRPFGRDTWPTGQGPRVWTSEAVARLASQNEELRMARGRK